MSSAPAPAAAVARCEVLVIGGGPAGSTIATLLARRGRHVVVVEKDRHPRFHIGESLLPLNLPLFERLGVKDAVAGIAMLKYGAQFNSVEHGRSITFDFADALDPASPYAYQVRRSEFDHLLLKHCAASGAEVNEGIRVTEVDFGSGDGVLVAAQGDHGATRRWRAQFLVDASGRDTFLAGRFGIKRRNAKHSSAALFGHFTGARRLPGREEGNISMFWFQHGWFWFIPLKDGTTSVGAVCWPYYLKSRKTDPTTFFLDTIALSPGLADRLRDARLTGPATATGNYSYQADRMAGDRYLLVGDAWGFIDPVFSAGVYLAMNGGFLGADVVDRVLADPRAAPRLYREYDRTVRRGLRMFSWMIYRMTSPAMRDLIMDPQDVLRLPAAVISFLAGDVFRNRAVLWRLYVFRALYYAFCLAALPTSLRAWRRRKR
ncbi:MAG: NAD(P)/FAD-dependent oxidoreductase, partial [Burkholderiales bacterium]